MGLSGAEYKTTKAPLAVSLSRGPIQLPHLSMALPGI